MDFVTLLAQEFHLRPQQIQAVIDLLDAGNTIPFIARYRKEVHGSLDDQTLREIAERLEYLRGLEKRRAEIEKSLSEQGVLTEELAARLAAAVTLAELEDLYRPFRPKRRTRATVAKERGLEPLALWLLLQLPKGDPAAEAAKYVAPEKEIPDAESALAGARDIIAESVSDDAALRKTLRALLLREGVLESRAAKEEDSVYRTYYEYSEPVARIAAHRVLALNRGEREEFLKVSLKAPEESARREIKNAFVRQGPAAAQVALACEDAWDRLLFPALEREIRGELTDRANAQAIRVFSQNLHQLLMQPPIKGKVTLGVDPGFRTGCKLAVVDENGKVLETGVGHFTLPGQAQQKEQSARLIERMARQHHVTAIAIGNGTASRESEQFIASLLPRLPGAAYVIVERGGSLRLFRQQAGRPRIPGIRRIPPQRGFHRPADAGSPGRAGEDRSQGHRRGAISARFEAERARRRPGRGGGAMRERRGRGGVHRLGGAAFPCSGHRPRPGEKYRSLPRRKRHSLPGGAEKGAQAGAPGLRAVRGLSAGGGQQKPPGRHGGASRKL